MEKGTDEGKEALMMGDANICTNNRNKPQYKHHRVATEQKSELEQNGIINLYMVKYTYLADNTGRQHSRECPGPYLYNK